MQKTIRRILCLALALVMALGLAACGESAPKEAAPTDAPEEYVYAAEVKTLADTPENGLNPLAYTSDGVYAFTWEKTGEREIPEDAKLRYEGEYDIYGSTLYFIGYDGTLERLPDFAGIETPEDDQDRMDYYGSVSLDRLFVNADGTLTAIEGQYLTWYDGPASERYGDNQWQYRQYEQHYFLRTLDAKGAELSRAEIAYDEPDSYLNIYNARLDAAGELICTSDNKVLIFAPDGSLKAVIPCNEYPDSLVELRDGGLAMVCWGENGEQMYRLDTEKGELGETVTLPRFAYNFLTGAGDYELYYQNGMTLYGFNLGDAEGTKVLNWINVDLNPDRMNGYYINDDASIVGLLSDWSGETNTCELVRLALVPASSLPVKQTLTLAVMGLDYQVQQKIIDFNRHSDTTRIQVVDYSEFNTEDDYSAGLTKLTTEIMAGNLPDLIALNQLPYDQMASKGLLEDLYPYLDKDEELSREDFFPTVLKALEVDGGLYQVAPSFQIMTLMGASSVVGDTPGWTYDEFNAALASMPAGCTPLDQYTTRDDVLSRLVTLELDRLVDWSSGKCSFDSPDYVDILNFADRFQESFDWENYEWSADDSTEKRIAEGRQMLMAANIYSIDDLLYNDFYFGGDATYIGYPTSEGVGSMMSLTTGFGMSAKCSDKDAAWAFLRTVLSGDYQQNLWGLPINVNAFNKKLKEAMTPEYQKDAEGNYLLDDEGERIELSRGGIGMADGTVYNFYAMTQEQADKLLEAIDTTTRVMNANDSLLSIIIEEAQAFFAGQKSAEEVARLTQSKVNIYVNEQR